MRILLVQILAMGAVACGNGGTDHIDAGLCVLEYNGVSMTLPDGTHTTPNQCCHVSGASDTCNTGATCPTGQGGCCIITPVAAVDGFAGCCYWEHNSGPAVDPRCGPLF